ncbi:hypothetical protein BDV95DRAFT_593239 [Massariosphaeria phaeospora]|uniref:Uncharacterized protein n=1 Tax=Massariosphaeria phaeospora TaxID=100035 RepID=A0A7C8IB98_9PLEO|nr:hypothetical protein BDV95DRAFT_593239 [Massariosphaeria phaeospora]
MAAWLDVRSRTSGLIVAFYSYIAALENPFGGAQLYLFSSGDSVSVRDSRHARGADDGPDRDLRRCLPTDMPTQSRASSSRAKQGATCHVVGARSAVDAFGAVNAKWWMLEAHAYGPWSEAVEAC